ncbi:hypothetical protein QN277_024179 [Acacia crassicarpa]|uniref:Uncharacterized protein n=1 Tax=Acacia crassicarpa TaxID=499986 RepID=A0AAE1JD52_9FABA|nr:hypothetical protein QN277_024179 [Acacia crassicarpa]
MLGEKIGREGANQLNQLNEKMNIALNLNHSFLFLIKPVKPVCFTPRPPSSVHLFLVPIRTPDKPVRGQTPKPVRIKWQLLLVVAGAFLTLNDDGDLDQPPSRRGLKQSKHHPKR